jgi:hypothetical protein
VLELHDLEDRAVDLDVVAVLELIGAYQGGSGFLESNLDAVAVARAFTAAGSR